MKNTMVGGEIAADKKKNYIKTGEKALKMHLFGIKTSPRLTQTYSLRTTNESQMRRWAEIIEIYPWSQT